MSSARVVDRPHASPWLLWAAEHHAERARRIEESRPDGRRDPWIEHRTYVISSLLAAVFFAEAFINELFQDVTDRVDRRLLASDPLSLVTARLPLEAQQRMASYWAATNGGRESIMAKFDAALDAARSEAVPAVLGEDVRVLVGVRNALVHFRPSDHFTSKSGHALETAIKGRRPRIPTNPIVGQAHRAYWLEHALGSGLAFWGVRTARRLADHTSERLGIEPDYAMHERGTWFDLRPGSIEPDDMRSP
jgi:hypothetical protein